MLAVRGEDLSKFPEYREVNFTVPAPRAGSEGPSTGDVSCWNTGYRTVCPEPVIPTVRRTLREGVDEDFEVIERGTPVTNAQGTIGRVDHLLIDPESGKITHLIVRRGVFAPHVAISYSEVQEAATEGVSVRVTNQEIANLPQYKRRAAEDVAQELHERLDASPADMSQAEVQVEAGIVTLAGWVPSQAARRRAESIARSIDGVIDVENRLVTDKALCAQITSALLLDARTSVAIVDVSCQEGVAVLEGTVDTAEICSLAGEIAARQPGVKGVDNQLRVEGDEDSHLLRARWWAEAKEGDQPSESQ
jgi:osmotically-inducible protein OsmY